MPVIEEKPQVRCAGCEGLFASNQVVALKGKSYCATCKENVLEDLKAGVSSDGLELASVGSRFVAQLIDGLIVGLPVIAIFIGMTGTMSDDKGLIGQILPNLIISLPFLLYAGFMLTAMGGRTIGKKVMKLRVVQVDGSEGTGAHFWKREAARWVLGLIPLIGLVDYLMAFGKGRRTLHDKMGGTIVVRTG